eukprot:TRINITY_DN3912_c0_g1_i5.p1 TRINITY_DN3912_c0_g1~~TRINITY_DN3912_c0_g1_i5.p1  ORF type:complete len:836 (+),score=153.86 TRINITY_DN3912_c0_g1_i5:121-2508(+)
MDAYVHQNILKQSKLYFVRGLARRYKNSAPHARYYKPKFLSLTNSSHILRLQPIYCTQNADDTNREISDKKQQEAQTGIKQPENTEKQSKSQNSKEEDNSQNQNKFFAMFGGVALALTYIKNIPQRWRHLRSLRKASDENPTDADKNAELLRALNKAQNSNEVIQRVESGNYASNSLVVVEYMKALVQSNRIMEYCVDKTYSVDSEHRSLSRLLGEMKSQVEGETGVEQPGYTSRNPLYIQVSGNDGGGIVTQNTPKNPVSFVVGIVKFAASTVLMITVFSLLWLVGAIAVRKFERQPIDPTSTMAGSLTQQYAPKEYNKENIPEKSIKTFKDVKGCDEAKEELQEVVEYLKNPDKFTKLGAKLPKGVLLTGPPGTGKTLLARAVAGEADVPFFYRAGSEFEEMFVGVGSRRVRALFQAAKKKAPCIIFVDEVDAVGGNRKHWENHSRKTLNQFLTEMDGFEENSGVVVMAATNMPETLDPALTRPGRFDRNVAVPLPDVNGRAEIVKYYLESKPIAQDVDALDIARKTPGFSGAQLFNLINEAALSAAKQSLQFIDTKLLDEARDKILMGKERKNLAQTLENRRLTAFHEAGHALIALLTPGAQPIHKATIVPRGHALGMVSQLPSEDEFSVSQQQCTAKIDVCMGGTVAEELVFGKDKRTTGAQSDLKQATEIARHMVARCGMVDAIGPVYVEDEFVSPDMKRVVDDEVSRLLKESQLRVKRVLQERLKDLQKLANALLQYETLTAEEIQKVLAGTYVPPPTVQVKVGVEGEKTKGDGEVKEGAGILPEPVLN